jgi:hypothetical protein
MFGFVHDFVNPLSISRDFAKKVEGNGLVHILKMRFGMRSGPAGAEQIFIWTWQG